MNELIQVKNENGELLVSARDLHEGLGISRRFSLWVSQYVNEDNKYGFEKDVDFTSVLSSTVVNNGAKRELVDFAFKIDMAKEICMITANDKGKIFRKYFIECEKKLKEVVPMITKKEQLLLQLFSNNPAEVANAHKQLTEIEVQEATKPLLETIDEKEAIIDKTISDDGLFEIGLIGKMLKPYCNEFGAKKIFAFLHDKGVLKNRPKTQTHNTPYDKFANYFEIRNVDVETTWGNKTYCKTYFNGKGLKWFLNKIAKEGYIKKHQIEEMEF